MFLHNYSPSRILLDLGPVQIYWYGFLIFLGMILGFLIFYKLAQKKGLNKNTIFDLVFWLVIWGVVGGRFYHILSEINYYWQNPGKIFFIWQGGLGIYGTIVAGFLVIWYFAKKKKLNFLLTLDLLVPSLALGQALGRWGNYFNQELYGRPTNLPWGIPIDPINRLPGWEGFNYFHPAFLYESLFCLGLFGLLLFLNKKEGTILKSHLQGKIFLLYVLLYSSWRLGIEFLRIDYQPEIWGLRLSQWFSIFLIIVAILFYVFYKKWYNNPVKSLGSHGAKDI